MGSGGTGEGTETTGVGRGDAGANEVEGGDARDGCGVGVRREGGEVGRGGSGKREVVGGGSASKVASLQGPPVVSSWEGLYFALEEHRGGAPKKNISKFKIGDLRHFISYRTNLIQKLCILYQIINKV